jgi:hypothetical protein
MLPIPFKNLFPFYSYHSRCDLGADNSSIDWETVTAGVASSLHRGFPGGDQSLS